MLEKFTVENYKKFKDPITINFKEVHDYRFNAQCVSNGLLSKAVIYGPNSSGKSTLGFALFDIVSLLTDKNKAPEQMDSISFLNADSDTKVARFEYCFKKDDSHIVYSYKKSNPVTLVYEELIIDGTKVFSYNFLTQEREFSNMELINAENLNFDYFDNNLSILRYIANNTQQPAYSYVRFLMTFVSKMLWFRTLQSNSYIGLTTGVTNVGDWIIENKLINEFEEFLHKMAGIDIKLEEAIIQAPNAVQKVLVEKHKNGPIVFDQCASSGVKNLQLFFFWSKQFESVSFLFVDEFDAFYHNELARNIVKYVSELDDIQVIFTTHNSSLASNDLLRPDCYFMLDKGKLASFVDITDRELREGHNIEKMLRNGEFDIG